MWRLFWWTKKDLEKGKFNPRTKKLELPVQVEEGDRERILNRSEQNKLTLPDYEEVIQKV